MSNISETIPAEDIKKVESLKVKQAGFAAGPSFIARKNRDYPEPVSLIEALDWLEEYRHVFRICHVLFNDNSVMWFERLSGFTKYELTDETLRNSGTFIQTSDAGLVNISLAFDNIKTVNEPKPKTRKPIN